MYCYFSEVGITFLVSAKPEVISCRLTQLAEDKIAVAVRLLMSGSLYYCVITAHVFLFVIWAS